MWQLKSNWSQLTNLETYLHLLNLTLPEIAAIIATVIGAATDLKTRKIYNWLTFPSAFIGIGLNAYLSGLQGIDIACVLMQKGDEVKGSFRTRKEDIDLNVLAQKFG